MSRFAFMVFMLFIPCLACGADVFVSPAGDDGGPGTVDRPFRTIQRGANRLEPSDTCYVREGVYRESVTLENSGIKGQPVRLRAYPGERPVLDGTEPVPGPSCQQTFRVPAVISLMVVIRQRLSARCSRNSATASGGFYATTSIDSFNSEGSYRERSLTSRPSYR